MGPFQARSQDFQKGDYMDVQCVGELDIFDALRLLLSSIIG